MKQDWIKAVDDIAEAARASAVTAQAMTDAIVGLVRALPDEFFEELQVEVKRRELA